jgi:hypothetical protein
VVQNRWRGASLQAPEATGLSVRMQPLVQILHLIPGMSVFESDGERTMNRFLVLLAALAAGSAQAWDCKYEKDIDISLNLTGSEQLNVVAAAGDLEIVGHAGTTEARVRGKVCASEEEWLDQAEIVTGEGRNASITVSLPDSGSGWSWTGSQYVYMDLEIDVPSGIALDVRDSSGDVKIEGTGAVTLQDSSGDIDIENVTGDVVLEDSSGDIDLLAIAGNVTVRQDSSGDIDGRRIEGAVRVEKDSSGDIRFERVRDDFVVDRDSSGDIVADTIGGDFRVLKNGSGEIRSSDVTGTVDIPDQG